MIIAFRLLMTETNTLLRWVNTLGKLVLVAYKYYLCILFRIMVFLLDCFYDFIYNSLCWSVIYTFFLC